MRDLKYVHFFYNKYLVTWSSMRLIYNQSCCAFSLYQCVLFDCVTQREAQCPSFLHSTLETYSFDCVFMLHVTDDSKGGFSVRWKKAFQLDFCLLVLCRVPVPAQSRSSSPDSTARSKPNTPLRSPSNSSYNCPATSSPNSISSYSSPASSSSSTFAYASTSSSSSTSASSSSPASTSSSSSPIPPPLIPSPLLLPTHL